MNKHFRDLRRTYSHHTSRRHVEETKTPPITIVKYPEPITPLDCGPPLAELIRDVAHSFEQFSPNLLG